MKILFLYTELADYFMASVHQLVKDYEVEVHIVRWPLKAEAPFVFQFPERVKVYERQKLDQEGMFELVEALQPAAIISSGWMDKGYVSVCKNFKGKIPVIGSMDNHWLGSAKQHLARLVSPFTIRRYFDYLWVPGKPQELYARKLGFDSSSILKGFYSADTRWFDSIYQQKKKKGKQLKRFLYVGRYIRHKGIFELWAAFEELQKELETDWELCCLGTGAEWENRREYPGIQHIGFVQPQEIAPYLLESSVFVLASHFEPWGVVVHEMAAAGFPLLCSRAVGAASQFLEEGKNGFFFEPADKDSLKAAMRKVMEGEGEALERMGVHSHQLSKTISPTQWSQTLMEVVERGRK
ncbi:glycosyltransferase family 4 protein [Nafulsella turpanensis]|uniref:glycosyltransferase family 4 protein n=1 Tax=Nafulsella turpanensis TaxID=1265690 RepID=UPI00034CC866|nr:glycosyltransferase family 4 protein [Nafulsella turpanensis]